MFDENEIFTEIYFWCYSLFSMACTKIRKQSLPNGKNKIIKYSVVSLSDTLANKNNILTLNFADTYICGIK